MRVGVTLEGMGDANIQLRAEIGRRTRNAIEAAGEGLLADLRDMTGKALGSRVANTWRLRGYPTDNAIYIWSKAPRIIQGNMTNGTIVPMNGSRYLAIPTARVPRARGRGAKAQMTPEQVEHEFNQDLIILKGRRAGTLLGFVEAVRGNSRRRGGLREATRGRVTQGRAVQRILMFTFVKSVRTRKRIDPSAAFRRWSGRAARMMTEG